MDRPTFAIGYLCLAITGHKPQNDEDLDAPDHSSLDNQQACVAYRNHTVKRQFISCLYFQVTFFYCLF